MKHHLLVLLFTIVSLQVFGQSQTQETYASSITAEELKEKLYTYASDEFEGRETGLRGQKIAVEYLRETYKKLGDRRCKRGWGLLSKCTVGISKSSKSVH